MGIVGVLLLGVGGRVFYGFLLLSVGKVHALLRREVAASSKFLADFSSER